MLLQLTLFSNTSSVECENYLFREELWKKPYKKPFNLVIGNGGENLRINIKYPSFIKKLMSLKGLYCYWITSQPSDKRLEKKII